MQPIGLSGVLILLAVTVVLVVVFRYLRLPQIFAYLCAGIMVGPHGFGWIPDTAEARYLAEFGLVFLMFSIGLEFSLAKLVSMRRAVLGLGGAQVVITCVLVAAVARWLGVPLGGAIVIGGMLAMSSTAIVMKLLMEQLEQNSRHGRNAFGVLLFQDLIVVPFLIFIPTLGGKVDPSVLPALGSVVLKTAIVLLLIFVIARRLVRPVLAEIAAARQRELFMLTVLLLTLMAAWTTHAVGLSYALGAFLAGMVLGDTEYRHQVEGDIAPFRDVLLGLFFITVGMLADIGILAQYWPWVLLLTGSIIVFKTLLIAGIARLFGIETGVALRTGLVLAQAGEFGFALLVQARQYDLLAGEPAQIVLASAILSMLLAPLIVRYNGVMTKRLVPSYVRVRESNLDTIREEAGRSKGHVIICGYGRSGQNLAWMLEQESIPSLALDLDPLRVREAREAGKPVVYGDADRRDVLEAAGLHRAVALAISFNNVASALRILEITRHVRPDMPVIVRTMDDVDLDRLKQAGATEIVPESLEGSLMMGSHLLLLLGVPMSRVINNVRLVRGDRYRMLRGFFHGEYESGDAATEAYRERLHAVTLPPRAAAAGKMLADLHLEEFGVSVSAVRRGGIRGPQPGPETTLQAGDVLVLFGAPETLEKAEQRLMQG